MPGRCVTVVGKGLVEITTCEPEKPGPGQVLVKADKTLISPGTERAGLLQLPNTKSRPPYVGGDCFVGTIEEVHPSVVDFKPGQRVYTQLRHKEYQVTGTQYLFPVPDQLLSEHAVFATLLHTSLQGVRKARVEIGTSVLVMGLGLIGQLACRLARLNGAVPVLAADMSGLRREKARGFCDEVFDPKAEDFPKRLLAMTGGKGPEVIIEATGFPEVIKTALDLAARLGRVVILGSSRGETTAVNFYFPVHKRGLTIIGAHITAEPVQDRQPYLWPRTTEEPLCLDLLARERITVSDLISDRYSANDAPKAYERLAKWDETIMGIVLDWIS